MKQQFETVKPMLQMQKAAIDNMVGGMIMFCDHANTMLNGAVGFPEEGKKAFRQWIEMNKKGCENLKAVIDAGYSNLEKMLEPQTWSDQREF
jgi:hypothetical protein